MRIVTIWLRCALFSLLAANVFAQPLAKSAIGLDPGNTKQTGASFTYRLTYNCSSTSGPCLGAEVDDLLPIELQFLSTVPASPTADVAAINVTPNFGGSGRTRVQFVLINPLPAQETAATFSSTSSSRTAPRRMALWPRIPPDDSRAPGRDALALRPAVSRRHVSCGDSGRPEALNHRLMAKHLRRARCRHVLVPVVGRHLEGWCSGFLDLHAPGVRRTTPKV
jgi:hypothetical protein